MYIYTFAKQSDISSTYNQACWPNHVQNQHSRPQIALKKYAHFVKVINPSSIGLGGH